ncbi:MAG: hypothetical protein JWN86_585 [Planctomycetota bacterium]|nr:hypothetical protein [Planctomycetota bacterium]
MRLIYQHADLQREDSRRRFTSPSDLLLHPAVREDGDHRDILPEDLGKDGLGEGSRWGVDELIRRGRQHAISVDGGKPDCERCISAGLFLAAKRNPIMPETFGRPGALALVRLALFDLGLYADPIDPEVRTRVEARLVAILDEHLEDDAESFRKYFFRGRDNVLHRISRRTADGGPIAREKVRQVLLELVFESYGDLGGCIDLQMRAFEEALRMTLTAHERELFRAIYAGQPYLGGLPLILLKDRFPFLKDAILVILEVPADRSRDGTLLRMCEYYSSMIANRRAADRQAKAQGQARDREGGVAKRSGKLGVTIPPNKAFPRHARLEALVWDLCKKRGINCACGEPDRWRPRMDRHEADDEEVVIDLECPDCDSINGLRMPRAEWEAALEDEGHSR